MNKKKYEKAEMEIITFECEDVITTSYPKGDEDEVG